MNNNEIKNRIAQINVEDFIWLIYIVIIIMSFYSNHLEKKFFLFDDKISKEKYRKILVIIFSILIVVYVYFLQDSFVSLVNLKKNASDKERNLTILSFIASLLIAISGCIFLYIALVDDNLNVELAFN